MRQIFARTMAWIDKAAVPQPPPSLQIARPALTLRVRSVRAATIRSLAPTNPEPAQVFHHGASKFRPRALRIQILIPQNQSSLTLDRPLRRDPEGPRMTDVQQPRWRRRQAATINSTRNRREAGRDLSHKNILAGSAVAPRTCCPPHGVYGGAHGPASRLPISRVASTPTELASLLPYHFRLRQPQRG